MKTEKPLVVEVGEEHIKRGRRASWCDCPIALALRRKTGRPWSVGVDLFWMEGEEKTYPLPPECVAFIERFDNNDPVQPFTFTLNTEE